MNQYLFESGFEGGKFTMPVVIVDGSENHVVGMVSSWDVLEKLVVNVFGDVVEQA